MIMIMIIVYLLSREQRWHTNGSNWFSFVIDKIAMK